MGNINTIPDFKVQLAMEVPLEKVKLPCIGQLKYNGTRCIAICDDGYVTFITRNGKTFKYPKLHEALQGYFNIVLDGELCFGDSQGSDHTKVSGIVNSSIHGTPIADHHNIQYNIFDMIHISEWAARSCTSNYEFRWEDLVDLVFHNPSDIIKLATTWEFKSIQDIQDKFAELLANDYEGLILKQWGHKYSFKRSKDWIKVKAIKTADLSCWSITPGKGKYDNMIGSLDCQGIVEGEQVCVSVGSGLTDAHRVMNEDHFLGKIIEVKYNTLIQDKVTGDWSLFLPRFVDVRFDK